MKTAFATSADGLSIAYETCGTRMPALVFVHGWSCDRESWSAQLSSLSDRHLVIALDLAGHGQSAAARRDWSIAAFADDVAAVVRAVSPAHAILIGHSMGADVVLRAWRLLRERVRGLIWVDQYSGLDEFMDETAVSTKVAPFKADFFNTTQAFVRCLFSASADPALIERIAAKMSSTPEQIAVAALAATWNHGRSVSTLLSEVTVPVVAINAERVRTDAESMRRHGVDTVLMPDVGHFPMLERPEEFNSCLTYVLQRFVRERCCGDA